MENLTFYVIRKPEKVKAVGEYLFDWLEFSLDRLKTKRGFAVFLDCLILIYNLFSLQICCSLSRRN